MNSKELMIGNYVNEDYGGLYQVVNINSEGFDYVDLVKPGFKAIGRYDLSNIKGIPITDEWLTTKFGFEQTVLSEYILFELDGVLIYKDGYGIYTNDLDTKFEFIHQVQNFYQASTLKELTILDYK